MHRFFLDKQFFSNGQVVLTPEISRQIKSVLRMKTSERIILLDNSGYAYESEIKDIQADLIRVEIIQKNLVENEPSYRLGLFVSLTQRENFELILQKCTETGVFAFHPFISERTTVVDTRFANKQIRWQSIIREAAEQSDRGRLPTLYEPKKFAEVLVEAAQIYDQTFIAWEECVSTDTIQNIIMGRRIKSGALFIGPKGGFSAQEIDEARSQGAKVISLGKRILKVETAAIVASFVCIDHFETRYSNPEKRK